MLKEYHGDTLYRLEYAPAILIPLFLALISSGVSMSLGLVAPIIGWIFLALSMNLMNDFIDKDRDMPLSGSRVLMVLSVVLAALGLYLLREHSLIFGIAVLVMLVLYNYRLKHIAIFKNVYLTIIACFLPYFAFAESYNVWLILALFFSGLVAEFLHSLADKDTTYILLKGKTIYFTIMFAFLFLMFSIVYVVSSANYNLWPFPIIGFMIFFGIIYLRKKSDKWVKVKKLGTELLKILTIYLLIVLLGLI